MVSTSSEVVRVMGVWVRRSDAGLAHGTARGRVASAIELERPGAEESHTMHDCHGSDGARSADT